MAERLRLLAVFPHPDDETMGLGGTLAKYSEEGVETYLICATHGERGWSGPEEEDPGFDEMARIREIELRAAVDELGLHELILLDYIDGDVDQANPSKIIGELTAQIRRIRPQVVVTFGPDGVYGHPDHIALAQFTTAALVCSADLSYQDPGRQSPHRVLKQYHMVVSKTFMQTFAGITGGISMGVDGIERSHPGWEEWAITTRIDTRKYFDRVMRALNCHQSQLSGIRSLLELPKQRIQNLLKEESFIRLFSLVNGGRQLEDDLFEGIPTQKQAPIEMNVDFIETSTFDQ